MVKAFGASMAVDALIGGSLGVELATGQLELVVAEAAIIGAVLLIKHFKKKRQEKAVQPNQDDDVEPEPADINEEDDNGQPEKPNQDDPEEPIPAEIEWDDVINQEAQQLQVESDQRIASLERQNNIIEPGNVIAPQPTQDEMFLFPAGVREEIEAFRRRRDEEEKKQNNGGGGNEPPNNGGNEPGNDPNNPGYPNNPYPNGGGNPNNRNPFLDMLDYIQYLQSNIRKKEEEEQKDETDENKKEHEKNNDENLHLIQDELEAQLVALGQSQLTAEKTYVELERIEQMIDQQIPDQVLVDPYTIYSSDIVLF